MSPVALSSIISLAILCATNVVNAQSSAVQTFPATPLVDKHWASPSDLPYKVDTDDHLLRGPQTGYNICNSTTEGPNSMCQTAYLNSEKDFCLWAPPQPNSEVFNVEGEMVAWCTQPGHGSRLIPAGAITGLQFMRTPDYVQVVGFLDQGKMNMIDGNPGGEMDGGGADLRGNPMGAAIFSNGFTGGDGQKYVHAPHWHNFMGNNAFCFKVCDPSKPNAAHFCEHIYDRIGCEFNAPNNAQKGTFEACEGENQDFPGTYTQNGVVTTYTQPPEELGAIPSMPYTARIPASSNCKPYDSASLFAAIATVTAGTTSGVSASATGSASRSGASNASGASNTPRGSSPTSSGAAPSGSGNSAETVAISGVASFIGVLFAALFLA